MMVVNENGSFEWSYGQKKVIVSINSIDQKIQAVVRENGRNFPISEYNENGFLNIKGIPSQIKHLKFTEIAEFFKFVFPQIVYLEQEQTYQLNFLGRILGGMDDDEDGDRDDIDALRRKRNEQLQRGEEEVTQQKRDFEIYVDGQNEAMAAQKAKDKRDLANVDAGNARRKGELDQQNADLERQLADKRRERERRVKEEADRLRREKAERDSVGVDERQRIVPREREAAPANEGWCPWLRRTLGL